MTLERWRSSTEWPLAIASLIFLGAYGWEVIGNLHGRAALVPEIITWIVWALFAVNYIVSIRLARSRWRWFYRNLHELAILIVPVLRPLRLLRLFGLVIVIERVARSKLRGRVSVYAAGSALLLVITGALAILDTEQNAPDATIRSFGDAIWWAFVTITTVGYGDFFPVTVLGRCVAVALMIAGIALLGTVTATIASLFIDLVADQSEKEEKVTRAQIHALTESVDELRRMLEERHEGPVERES